MNRELAQTLVAESNAAVHWMREVGINWEPLKEHAKVDGKRYFERGIAIHVAGGGIGQLTQWRRIAESLGIEIRFEFAGLRRARRPAPRRGRARQRPRRPLRPHGQGGDRLRRRLPGQPGNARALSRRQHRHDEGARQPARHRRGAALAARPRRAAGRAIGSRATCRRSTPTRPISRRRSTRTAAATRRAATTIPTASASMRSACASSTRARRSTPTPTPRPAAPCSAQPGARAYQIYDQKGIKCFRYPHHKATYVEAGHDRGARRRRSGIEPTVLMHTVEEFNRAVPGRHAVRSAAAGRQGHRRVSRSRNRTGRPASTSRRSAPIR